ncbi:hypothetical protein BC939DRAFT_434156 [Gamsiella multidivaricata]|uniref:uncharacterized protein n=1 Tax=Gamsiella multidivaricata TaxID=101098 RepID=UPI0022204CAB|nr:uncharacterized protein BC939DRAFT_434156 [Gamsiella multidivaricata]KAI7832725.1 hypothetical protein BC939DRAFT_434156 [Gamsiella multidivaricata]
MSFNLGNNDRLPSMGSTPSKSSNPLHQAANPSTTRSSADMVLTPDHPAWHADHSQDFANQQQHEHPQRGSSTNNPSSGLSSGQASATGRFRAGPDADSYLPPDAVPQGARFDPIMPDDVRQGLPHRGPGQGQGQGRVQGQGLPGSGEPDFDELLPPR